MTLSEEEGEATSDALCEGGVSGDSSRTLRGTAVVKHRLEIYSRVFSNTERGTAISQQRVALKIARTVRKECKGAYPTAGKDRQRTTIRKERKEQSLTARHKCALQGTDGDDSHRSKKDGE